MKRLLVAFAVVAIALGFLAATQVTGNGDRVVASTSPSGLTTAASETDFYTVPVAGFYRITATSRVTQAGTGTSMGVKVYAGGVNVANGGGVAIGATSTGTVSYVAWYGYLNAGELVGWGTTYTSVTGNPTYRVNATVEKMFN